jgi:hypothetical protein
MSTHAELIDRYIALWNETEPARRRDLIAQTFTPTASYVDPAVQGDGHAGIDAMIAAVQQRYPGYRFRLTGPVETHHDRLRFTWSVAPAEGPTYVKGTDFAVLAADRLQAVTGFFDYVDPQLAAKQ